MTDSKNPDQKGTEDEWAEAMAEQQDAATDSDESTADAEEDLWAAAMAEQEATEDDEQSSNEDASDINASRAQNADHEVFKQLDEGVAGTTPRDLDLIMDIPVKLSVELGRTRITIKQLLELAQGSVIELDGLAGEPMDILINGYLIAQGEVVVVDDKYGIRITEIITPSERVKKLNK
ncbi:flagellar motor switch protein FliN/FliY [Chromohalobacter marismortui]|uniref:Flagellar motor switch protein FliN n=1 Tax=Chromohalobacter marismortui TaxID=42055 RepID=A0A4R7NQ66_9GAMM|nr:MULTISPECIES: flagellar motor switch protein FliN [Chromohalobacter]MCI0508854.1 flagellar motor switch protein FliN [Chromohalobacter sp.]MCI0594289.1 flagellar motor switch protein FliN [Chromohalobacter sp.]TDU22772.1 flagellar motor switch protein FliN/FliY [Chromohalobacter marismortui]